MFCRSYLRFIFQLFFLFVLLPLELCEGKLPTLLPGQNQAFMLTNQQGCFYFGQSGARNQTAAEGFNVQTMEFLEDYFLIIEDKIVSRRFASAQIGPNKIIRHYYDWPLTEEIWLAPTENMLQITLHSSAKLDISFYPVIPMSKKSEKYIAHWQGPERTLYFARKNHLIRTADDDYPVWLGISTLPEPIFVPQEVDRKLEDFPAVSQLHLPGRFSFQIDSVAVIMLIVGDQRDHIRQIRKDFENNFQFLIKKEGFKLDRLFPQEFQKTEYIHELKPDIWRCDKNL